MKRIVITGASGFIGKSLVKELLRRKNIVYAVVRMLDSVADIQDENFRPIQCDFNHYYQLAELIPKGVEYFIHFAWAGVSGANSKSPIIQLENIKASVIALDQASLIGVKKFLFAGSSYQYRMEPIESENGRQYIRKNIYGIAKQSCTDLLRAEAINRNIVFNSVLFTNVFGVGDFSNRSTNTLISKLLRGEDLQLIPGDHLHDWLYIDDAIRGILSILERGKSGKSYYVGNRELHTFKSIVTEVRNIIYPKAKLKFGFYPDDGFIDYSKIDLDVLYQDTGFLCKTAFDGAIKKTADWISAKKGIRHTDE